MCKILSPTMSRSLRTFTTLLVCFVSAEFFVAESFGLPREKVGESLGQPVYRDQVYREGVLIKEGLFDLFAGAAVEKFRRAHEAEWKATKEELDFAAVYFDAEFRQRKLQDEQRVKAIDQELAGEVLNKKREEELRQEKAGLLAIESPTGRDFAEFIVMPWKFQRYLYENYGGGRILWQQAGLEAYDATRKWLESLEAKGDFKITDPKAREAFYAYWTRQGGVFIKDEAEMRKPFWNRLGS